MKFKENLHRTAAKQGSNIPRIDVPRVTWKPYLHSKFYCIILQINQRKSPSQISLLITTNGLQAECLTVESCTSIANSEISVLITALNHDQICGRKRRHCHRLPHYTTTLFRLQDKCSNPSSL